MKYELFDIITLEDNKEYCIIRMLKKDNVDYFLLNMIENEEATSEYKIVRYINEGNDEYIEGISDNSLLDALRQEFAKLLEQDDNN